MDENNVKHKRTKLILRIIGICLLAAGAVFVIWGMVDFFTAVNGNNMNNPDSGPTKFWMLFIGFPALVVGLFLTITSFHREIAGYMANEQVPVINMTAKGVAPGVSDIAKATVDGIKSGEKVVCNKCGEINEKGDKFCSKCGNSLVKICPNCGAELEDDDVFCSKCGTKLE